MFVDASAGSAFRVAVEEGRVACCVGDGMRESWVLVMVLKPVSTASTVFHCFLWDDRDSCVSKSGGKSVSSGLLSLDVWEKEGLSS